MNSVSSRNPAAAAGTDADPPSSGVNCEDSAAFCVAFSELKILCRAITPPGVPAIPADSPTAPRVVAPTVLPTPPPTEPVTLPTAPSCPHAGATASTAATIQLRQEYRKRSIIEMGLLSPFETSFD